MPTSDESFSETLVALHHLMGHETSLGDSLRRVADLTRSALPQATAVGLTLRSGTSGTTVAFSGDLAPLLDESQYRDETGPCLDCFHDGRVIVVDHSGDHLSEWPTYVRTAVQCGVHSSLSLPLIIDGLSIGALNIYAHDPDAFDRRTVEMGGQLADQAAIAVGNAEIYWRARQLAENLQNALDSRDVIGQAKGILMRDRGIRAEEAFELLRSTSQRRNIKVRDLAEEVTVTGELIEQWGSSR